MIMPTGWTGWTPILLTVRGDVMRWYLIGYVTCCVLLVAFKVAVVTAVVIGVASCVGVL